MAINPISAGEQVASVRAKLNAAIAVASAHPDDPAAHSGRLLPAWTGYADGDYVLRLAAGELSMVPYTGSVTPATLVFEALAASAHVMTALLTGTGALAIADPGVDLYAPDFEGVYRFISRTSPSWHGARISGGVAYATDVAGATLTEPPLAVVSPSYVQRLAYNRSLNTAGGWSAINGTDGSVSKAQNVTGIDGVANKAITLTVGTAPTANAPAGYQYSYSISAGARVTTTALVKAFSSNTHTVAIAHSLTGGTAQYERGWLNPYTGVSGASGTNTTVQSTTETIGGETWYRLTVSTLNVGTNTSVAVRLCPAYAGTAGGTPATGLTGAAVFDAAMSFIDTTLAAAHAALPMLHDASGAPFTLAASDVRADGDNHANTASAYGLRVRPLVSKADMVGDQVLIAFDTTPVLWYEPDTGLLVGSDGTNTASVAWDAVAGTDVALALVYDDVGGTLEVGVDGTYGTAASYDDSFGTPTDIRLGYSLSAPWALGQLRRYA